MSAILTSIVYSPEPGSYNRKSVRQAVLVAGYGIEDDRKGGHPKRHLNIMDQESLELLAAQGIPIGPGVLGENLILKGMGLDGKPAGTRLRIGSQAIVESVELRTGCYKLTALDARLPGAADDRLGVMARVVTGGTIRVGDAVEWLAG